MVETAYVRCVFCGLNKPHKSNKYPAGFFEIPSFEGNPEDEAFIIYMDQSPGPGRGRHEKVGGWVRTGGLSLREALFDPEFSEVAGDFKAKLISLVKAYLEDGVLQADDLF